MSDPNAPIETPCIQVCTIDRKTGFCLGCYRSREEIALWSRLTPAERRTIMAGLKARAPAVGPR